MSEYLIQLAAVQAALARLRATRAQLAVIQPKGKE